ncbi:hypothetical protein WQ68_18335, partial [Escherichia coli]
RKSEFPFFLGGRELLKKEKNKKPQNTLLTSTAPPIILPSHHREQIGGNKLADRQCGKIVSAPVRILPEGGAPIKLSSML